MSKVGMRRNFFAGGGDDIMSSSGDLQDVVRRALAEDVGKGDITTKTTVPDAASAVGKLIARQSGTVAGLEVFAEAFRQVDFMIAVEDRFNDGDKVTAGDEVALVRGYAEGILTGERTALNFLCHLSGIATATRALVDAIQGTKATILDTRKTTPGLRKLEKAAVRAGGGTNHRFGLYDAFLIKDNHLAFAGGVEEAVRRARSGSMGMRVQVEVETLNQLREAVAAGADSILLDNMDCEALRQAVDLAGGKVLLEASGGITLETVRQVAETGVDFISVGWITHSAPILDFSLELQKSS